MSNIATSAKIASMGFKLNPAQEAAVKARAAAKKKVGDLSFKPSDAQKRAILRMETNKTMAELEKSLRDEEPAPAPKADPVAEMRAKKIAESKASMAIHKKAEESRISTKTKKSDDFAVGKGFVTSDGGRFDVIAKDHMIP